MTFRPRGGDTDVIISAESPDETDLSGLTDGDEDTQPEDTTDRSNDGTGDAGATDDSDEDGTADEDDAGTTEPGITDEENDDSGLISQDEESVTEDPSDLSELIMEEETEYVTADAMNATDESIFEWNGTIITGLKDKTVTSITIPAKATKIDKSVFQNCTSLKSVIFEAGSNLGEIGYGAFYNTGISSIDIPNSVTTIGTNAFRETKLTKIVIPQNVTTLGDAVFHSCKELAEVELQSKNITSIGKSIFYNCKISKVTFPSGIVEIPANLFYAAGMTPDIVITIPKTVKTIGSCAFYGADQLSKVLFEDGSVLKVIEDQAFYETGISSIDLPNSVTTIKDWALRKTKLTSIVIPENVTTIGDSVFKDCESLSEVDLRSKKLTSVGVGVFQGCNIKSVIFPAGITEIPKNLFRLAGFLNNTTSKVEIPSTVTTIGANAFYECSGLSMLIIPASVKKIGTYAFWKLPAGIKVYVVNGSVAHKRLLSDGYKDHTVGDEKSIIYTTTAVSYVLNGGVNDPDNPTVYDDVNVLSSIKAPTREGYKFDDWYTDKALKNKFDASKYTTVQNITLYAKWILVSYTITYYPNASGTTPSAAYKQYIYLDKTEEQALNTPTFKRNGFSFVRWDTKAAGNGVTWEDGQVITQSDFLKAGGNLNLYAIWEREGVTITFDDYGNIPQDSLLKERDKVTNNNINTIDGKKDITLLAPVRTGFTFLGWYTEKDGGSKVTKVSKNRSSDITLYARWRENSYKIIWNANGGTVNADGADVKSVTDTLPYTAVLTNTPYPQRKGYNFLGWYDNKVGNGEKYTSIEYLRSTNNASVTLYAKWEAKKYTITYNEIETGDTNANPASGTYGKQITLKNPSRTGWTFGGWYTDSAYTTKVTKIAKTQETDLTLYAKWTENTYTLTYNANGASGTVPDGGGVKNYSDEITIPGAGVMAKKDHTFLGWSTAKKGNYAEYVEGQEVLGLTAKNKGKITLYAVWAPSAEFTVTYNLNGGKGTAPAKQSGKQNESFTFADNSGFTRAGYEFKGWAYKKAATEPDYIGSEVKTPDIPFKGNVTLYAVWKLVDYTITYNVNGGTMPAKYATTRSVKANVTLPKPTRTGYTFAGWYEQSDFSGAKLTTLKKTDLRNVPLYAKWTENEYTVTFNYNKGIDAAGKNKSAKKVKYTDTNIYPTDVTRTGYTLTGWNTKANGKGVMYYDTSTSNPNVKNGGKITLYAIWQPVEYKITYNLGATDAKNNLNPTTYTVEKNVILRAPSRAGYKFVGWYDATSGKRVTVIKKSWAKDITLTAEWQPK